MRASIPWLRLAAIGFVAVALAVGALQLRRPTPPPVHPGPVISAPLGDPLAGELARCQGLGEAGAGDRGCLAAWAASRRRFLGLSPQVPKE